LPDRAGAGTTNPMDREIYKVTDINPRLSMEMENLLRLAGLSERNAPNGDLFASFESDGTLTGAVSGRQFEKDSLLRFVAVREEQRRESIGSALVGRLLSYYSGACERTFVLSPPPVVSFFARFGFEGIRSDGLPGRIRDSADLARVRIASCEIMSLELPKKWPIV